ncbi:MAG: discoidin domain-containing protein, partial [Verrucomicrobiae bacterium]|nr:discoidin domain-containing protein [Verrucomicrobiae bacterium]
SKPPAKLSPEQLSQYKHGQEIYQALCFACHGADGKGTALPGADGITLAPSFLDSAVLAGHRDLAPKVVLYGLTGPINGKAYPGEMIAMASNGDAWVAAVLSYIRNSFGNQLGFITEAEVARVREETGARTKPWTMEELLASVPQTLANREQWKLTASDGAKDLKFAVDGDSSTRYTTGKSMAPGMWVQIELPEKTKLAGVILDAATSRNDFPRGFEVTLSEDGKKWNKPVAKGKGETARTEIDFDAQTAKFVRITQTGSHKLFWSIHELDVLGAAD